MKLDVEDIVISAPGKVILHGEHAVVYKKRALAASLDLRTYLRLRVGHGDEIKVSLPDIDVNISWSKEKLESSLDLPLCAQSEPMAPNEQILERLKDLAGLNSQTTDTKSLALVAFLYLFCSVSPKDNKLPAVDLHLSSRLPPSAGLGSSAAYSVCLATGLLEAAGVLPCPDASHPTVSYSAEQLDLINRWAFQAEKVIHGNPSGIDNAISTHGGALCFQAGTISPIAKVPKLDILLTNTKVPRSTKILVAGVKEKYKKFPGIIEPVIDSIEAITTKCEEVFKEMEDGAKEEHFDVLKCSVANTDERVLVNYIQALAYHSGDITANYISGAGDKCSVANTDERVLVNYIQALAYHSGDITANYISGAGDKELVSMNQRHLAVLGVSHPTLEAVCHVTAEHNLQSKLTGAGGGGCALTLLTPATDPTVVSKVKEELTLKGFVCWETAIGGPGVQRIVEQSQLEHSPANFKLS